MYLVDALRVLVRRWKIVLAGTLALLAAAAWVVHYVPTQYQASGQILLTLPADSTGEKTPTNPFLNLQPGLITVATLTAGSVTTKDEARSMADDGFTSSYAVAVNPGTGPLIVVTAEDSDPVVALRTRDEVMRRIDLALVRLQANADIPSAQLISGRQVSVPPRADVLPGSKIRALAVAGGGIVLLTLLVAFAWEGLASRRQQTLRASDDPDSGTISELRSPDLEARRTRSARPAQPPPAMAAARQPWMKVPPKNSRRRTARAGR